MGSALAVKIELLWAGAALLLVRFASPRFPRATFSRDAILLGSTMLTRGSPLGARDSEGLSAYERERNKNVQQNRQVPSPKAYCRPPHPDAHLTPRAAASGVSGHRALHVRKEEAAGGPGEGGEESQAAAEATSR